jgi:hypothetical protein
VRIYEVMMVLDWDDGVGLGWWCLVSAFLVSVLSFSRLYTYEYRKQFSTQRETTHEQKDTP